MKTNSLVHIVGAALGLALTPAVWAQTTPGSMLYQPTVDLSAGPQNTHVGTVGGVFLTTYNYWPKVNWLGYYDKDGDGLASSHVVSLWDGGTMLASATVPAGTSAPLINGYRWAPLTATVDLWYNHWYVIGAQTDGVDTWGDLITAGASQVTWNPEYLNVSTGYEFSRAGRYDSSANWPSPPANQSGSDAIYPVANMGYNLSTVPEPACLSLLGLGAALYFGLGRKRKN